MARRAPWLTSELGVLGCLDQAVALCRRGLSRPWLTLLVAALLGAALTGFVIFRHHDYAPRFVLRVVEADRDRSTTAPALKRQLAAYVREGVFVSEPLLQVMQRHDLYPSLRKKNTRAALEAFKEDIQVEVYQNYFVEQRRSGAAPRSARLTVSFHARDPNLALAVTRDLGALVVKREQDRRREQAQAIASRAEQARDVLVQAAQRRASEIFQKRRQLEQAKDADPRTQVELVGLLGSLDGLERKADAAEKRTAAIDMSAALERGGVGMYFDVVDEGALPGRAAQLQGELLGAAVAIFLALPLIAMAVGAATLERTQP
jgi:hypothetical protein